MGKRMQKLWQICRTTLLGLSVFWSIFLPSQVAARCIWESIESGHDFVFSGLDKVFLYEILNSDQTEKELKQILTNSLQNRGKVLFIQDLENQIMGALGESKLFLNVYFMPTENSNINALRIFVTAGAEATKNQAHFLATVWDKMYLFENPNELNQDVSKALKESINLLLSQYFTTNPQAKGKAVFYYPQPVISKSSPEKSPENKSK